VTGGDGVCATANAVAAAVSAPASSQAFGMA
jgi:hypothetical protein